MPHKSKLPLGFTARWVELGIISQNDIQNESIACANSTDHHPEHYRWRAFSRFIEEQRSLSPEVAQSLFQLGAEDGDRSTSGAIMAAVLRHRACPPELMESCLGSDQPHIRALALRRLTKHEAQIE